MNGIPAVCDFCGFSFPSPFSLAGHRNSVVQDCATNCPRCGATARVVDSYADSQGEIHFLGFVNSLKAIKNTEKLEQFKDHISANEDKATAENLTEALTELDPSFSKFSSYIAAIPPGGIKYFINMIMAIITLVIAYQTWQSADENHKESIDLQRDQLDLAREEFEYKKQKDRSDSQAATELQDKIDSLHSEFEAKIESLKPPKKAKKTPKLKGCDRNKPCPCGSGLKAKKCHPEGFLVKI